MTIISKHGIYTVREFEHEKHLRRTGHRQYWTEYQVRLKNRVIARHDKLSEAKIDAEQRWDFDKWESGRSWF